jgi:hypothetical protein
MSHDIQVLTTLEYLGPYPTGSSSYYFGVVLQVGVPIGDDGELLFPVSQNQAPLLQPWLWTNVEVNIWPFAGGSLGTPLKLVSAQTNPTLHPRARYALDQSILDRIGKDFSTALADQDFGWSDPQKQGASARRGTRPQYPWPAYLAQLSRYPFPIPHLLNLAFIVKVDPSTPLAKDTTYVAAVKFTTKIAGTATGFTPKDAQPADAQGRVCVSYEPAGLVTCTMPLTIPSLAPSEPILTSALPEITDWQAHLVAGCADLFDLPTRLIDSVRKDCNDNCTQLQTAVAASFGTYIAAVLAAQRNIVAYGCQAGPDGSSLLRRLCDRWVGEGWRDRGKPEHDKRRKFADDFLKRVTDQFTKDRANSDQAQDKWLLLLKKNASLATSSLIGAPPDAPEGLIYDSTVTYKKGNTVLYHAQMFMASKEGKLPTPSSPSTEWSQISQDISTSGANLSDRLIALEHLQLQFTQSDLLSSLLLAQWDQFPQDKSAHIEGAMFQSLRNSAASALADLNVRDLLLQGNLHDSWDAIIANASRDPKASRTSLRANIPNQLSQRIKSLLTALPTASAKLLADASNASALKRMDTLVPLQLDIQGTAPSQATRTSEGMSVLLDGLDAADSGKDAADNLRQMSGLCVLMREKKERIWRCLDVGYPMTTPPSKQGEQPKSPVQAVTGLSGPIVIPVPQHNQDALRRAILTYNNQPLMSESPAHGFSKGLVPEPSNAKDRLISFEHPAVSKCLEDDHLTQWKIPGLAFGRSYDFLIGRVSNSGALPPSFADPKLGPAILSFEAVKASAHAPSVSDIPYKRAVPIAALRFGSSENPTSVDKIDFPAIPADVHPRSSEIYPSPSSIAGSNHDKPAYPLVMLTPYKVKVKTSVDRFTGVDSFTLKIRKPTTDLLTWDRWKAALDSRATGDNAIWEERRHIWSRFHVLARQESTQNNVALDDPAVVSLNIDVCFEGKPVPVNNSAKSWQTSNKPLPTNVLQNASDPLSLTFTTSLTAATATVDSSDATGWVVTLPPGGVAKVTLTPVVDAAHVEFFAPGIVLDPKKMSTLQPYTFLIESANQNLPSVPEIFAAFKIAPPASPAATSVDFSLTPPDPTATKYNTAWQQVRGADLQTQIWRWDGRPSRRFPFADVVPRDVGAQGTTPGLLEWELETFSTRLAFDATIRPMTFVGAKIVDTKNVPANFAAHDDRGTELGATYYRAAVTVYNRYGSLVPENPPIASKVPPPRSVSTLNVFASVPGADGGWARRFIPARLTPDASVPKDYKPPKPAIKFMVPLTGSTSDSQAHAASVLVVVQGPWYAIGGLAEDICAHIMESEHEENGKKVKEAGPDPISFEGAKTTLPTDYEDYGSLYPDDQHAETRFHGPIGHTFDSSDVNPLWVTSTFVLDPPKPKDALQELPENSFARVQFQRVILKDGLVVEKGGSLVSATDDFPSEPTDPVWIQFLPSRLVAFHDLFQGLKLDVSIGIISIKDTKGTIVTLSQPLNVQSKKAIDSPHLIFGLLLTEEVPDLLGRNGQERFQDVLLQPSTDKPTLASWKSNHDSWKSDHDSPNIVGRIVAIQRQVNVSPPKDKADACQDVVAPLDARPPCTLTTSDELWSEMFPQDGRDVMARIVAISPPITKTASISCAVNPGGKN